MPLILSGFLKLFSIILIFLLCGQITRQAARQVVTVPCRPQPIQKGFQIVLHVTPHHLAALDHRVHERVVPGRPLASDVPAFFRFIFIRRIICSLRLFDSSTSPHSSTLFIAGHSPIAYFRAFLSSSPQPAKSDFRNTSRRSSILLICPPCSPGLRRCASLSAN